MFALRVARGRRDDDKLPQHDSALQVRRARRARRSHAMGDAGERLVEWLAIVRVEFFQWLQRCTPLRVVVSVVLLGSITVWAVAVNIIAANANVPELATVESPRTLWSCKGRSQQMARWYSYQSQLAAEAVHYEPASPYDNRARLLLLGDSITESWRGTSMGEPRSDPWAASMPSVLEETLGKRWPSPLVQGISGDQTQHVLWRLAHGEISARMAGDARLVVVLMIGTNNLGMGHTPEQVVEGIGAVIAKLLNLTKGRILVNALLPRGDGQRRLPALCPPSCAKNGKPLRSFRPLIERVNALLNLSMGRLAARNPGRVSYVDCGKLFDPSGMHRAAASTDQNGGSGGGGLDGLGLISGGARAVGDVVSGVVTHPTAVLAKTEQAFIGAGERVIGVAEEYLNRGGSDDVRLELMPDRLHPNADGQRLWAGCIEQAIGEFES